MGEFMEFTEFTEKLQMYSYEEQEMIKKAFYFARHYHEGQYRQSGEEYIIHPLNVANILMSYHADCDTVCAGLLHDVLEDTKASEKEISDNFNPIVLLLVKGVTNLNTPELTKKEAQIANIRKVITSITKDIRIIIIKLADRLHNMRTLEYKNTDKQVRKSVETLEIYAPLANSIGAYNFEQELEDLSLRYLLPEEYKKITEKYQIIQDNSEEVVNEMMEQIETELQKNHINNSINTISRNIYGIYKNLKSGKTYDQMHDIIAIKTLVKDYQNCYQTLGIIHQLYPCYNNGFKDYISAPKTNMYQGIHTTVFGPNDQLVQNQIRTYEMEGIAQNGLMYYWQENPQTGHLKMQSELNKKFQFYRSLNNIIEEFSDNQDFVAQVQFELLDKKVYVYTTKGVIIELPLGATVVDAAYHIGDEVGNYMISAIVNDKPVDLDYELKNKDRLRIITGNSKTNQDGWEKHSQTAYARCRIKELNASTHEQKGRN